MATAFVMDSGSEYFRAALARVESRRGLLSDIEPPQFRMTAVPAASEDSDSEEDRSEDQALRALADERAGRVVADAHERKRRKRFRLSVFLFFLTFVSTTLVGSGYWPLEIVVGMFNEAHEARILQRLNTAGGAAFPASTPDVDYSLTDRLGQAVQLGCTYSIPLMLILLCHEMGHYLQAVRYRVPASYPFFIPLPLPPLGTMGAIILQGQGRADRKMLFDIAVSGPIAGLVITIPVLWYGIATSGFVRQPPTIIFGEPPIVQWMIEFIHGPVPPGTYFAWNGFATAGWVGVFITAMNLLPIGQLDGGHLLYTLIGRAAHWVAWSVIAAAVGAMLWTGMYSYVLLLVLLLLTGPRHPPTANDRVRLGITRTFVGWVTLAFLMVGFTLQPLAVPRYATPDPESVLQPVSPGVMDRLDF